MRDMYLLKNTIEIPKSISTATKKLVRNLVQISFAAKKFLSFCISLVKPSLCLRQRQTVR